MAYERRHRRSIRARNLIGAASATTLLAAGTLVPGAAAAAKHRSGHLGAPTTPHVMVLMMENRSYQDVLGPARYQTLLARRYASFTNSYGVGHYSLDNYLAALSGRFFSWATGDCSPGKGCESSQVTLVNELSRRHISWDAYLGAMPANCAQQNADSGTVGHSYGVRHNPFVYFPDLVRSSCDRIQPSSRMLGQLNSATAPDFVWYSPQICHDGGGDESCATLANGDSFLAHEIPAIEKTAWYRQGGVIILTYDEGNGSGQGQGEYLTGAGNHVLTVVIAKQTLGKGPDNRYLNEFGILAGIERAYHVPCLAEACNAANGVLPLPGQ